MLCPDGARTVVHFTLRRRAGRPQLKRDPLGRGPYSHLRTSLTYWRHRITERAVGHLTRLSIWRSKRPIRPRSPLRSPASRVVRVAGLPYHNPVAGSTSPVAQRDSDERLRRCTHRCLRRGGDRVRLTVSDASATG